MSLESQACAVPLVERLRSVPIGRREMVEINPTEHRNIPYGNMLHEAADEITRLLKLTAEVYTAMLAAGWHEENDTLMQRVREEAKKQ
jgi:hypothetical protein